jgi:SpoVK/Ycf46/Vps4 family AAA+-type ATPase
MGKLCKECLINSNIIKRINDIKSLIDLSNRMRFSDDIDLISLWKISPYLKEIDKMVGFENVKNSLVYQILYYIQGLKSPNDYLHVMIYGQPGSGKTTLAILISKIYTRLNILKNDKLIFGKRDDFIAGYLGQTAQKTTNFLNSCIGSVLFIDEIYSIGIDTDDKDSFAKEALNTLNAFLSENRNNFCCIGAGYKEDIENNFFKINKGLKRRFQWIFEINTPDVDNKIAIFRYMFLKNEWQLDVSDKFLKNLLRDYIELFEFGGGSIETFITKCKMSYSVRIFGTNIKNKKITEEDVINTIQTFYSENKIEKSYNMMYM